MIVDDRFGLLKLADFGNARVLKRYQRLNSYQVTRYYRAPELVFGTTEFTTSIGSFKTQKSYFLFQIVGLLVAF